MAGRVVLNQLGSACNSSAIFNGNSGQRVGKFSNMLLPFIIRLLACLLSITSAATASPSPAAAASSASAIPTFGQRTIFTPPSTYNNPRVLYARSALLPDNHTLLATWENYSPEPPHVYFPIYRSLDSGSTWHPLSNITDSTNSWGLRYQPILYVLPSALSSTLPAGTLLCAGNSIPQNLSQTQLDLYASTDSGQTWHFISHIASGGRAEPTNGQTPVWEPFLTLFQGKLVVFYSDQRDPKHGQKLVHQVSADGRTWAAPVDDVAYTDYGARPGMPVVSALPNGRWLMTYEYGGGPMAGGGSGYQFPVYYKTANSPLAFGGVNGTQLVAADGTQLTSSPYNVWMSLGGAGTGTGMLVVSANSDSRVFVNKKLGDPKSWTAVDVSEQAAYSRSLTVLDGGTGTVMLVGAGVLGGNNSVSNAVVRLS